MQGYMKKVFLLMAVIVLSFAACAQGQKKTGNQKASGGMRDLAEVLKQQNARVDSVSWSAKLSQEEQERLAKELIAKGSNINFIKWETGSVLPETGRAMEHMASFDYGYKIAAVRDWLFEQSKDRDL
jgi:hypothetical protein